ncbi:MAG: hypothetical protein AAB457_04555 [Patescibacteria group bacterium]
MGAMQEVGAARGNREGWVVTLEGLELPSEFELREGEDNRFLYHNVCGDLIATLGLQAGPEAVSKAVDDHWCPRQGQGIGVG